MRKSVLTGMVAFVCLSSSCLAAEYFVATKGRDANPGSKARPWKTVARAVKRAKPGDTVILRRGIYRAARFDLGPAGRKSRSKTVFKAFGGERVILTAPNGKPPGFALRDYVRVEGLWIGGVCIITRNFVSGYFWDVVMSGSDHLIAHNTLWRNTGQKGREPGWNAWLPAKRVIFANNILNSEIPIYGGLGTGGVVSHNAYLVGPPQAADVKPIDLREGRTNARTRAAIKKWSERIDKAVKQIDGIFKKPVEQLLTEEGVEQAFDVLKLSPPKGGALGGAGKNIGFSPRARSASIGRSVVGPADLWKTFDTLGLKHFNSSGEKIERRIPTKSKKSKRK